MVVKCDVTIPVRQSESPSFQRAAIPNGRAKPNPIPDPTNPILISSEWRTNTVVTVSSSCKYVLLYLCIILSVLSFTLCRAFSQSGFFNDFGREHLMLPYLQGGQMLAAQHCNHISLAHCATPL